MDPPSQPTTDNPATTSNGANASNNDTSSSNGNGNGAAAPASLHADPTSVAALHRLLETMGMSQTASMLLNESHNSSNGGHHSNQGVAKAEVNKNGGMREGTSSSNNGRDVFANETTAGTASEGMPTPQMASPLPASSVIGGGNRQDQSPLLFSSGETASNETPVVEQLTTTTTTTTSLPTSADSHVSQVMDHMKSLFELDISSVPTHDAVSQMLVESLSGLLHEQSVGELKTTINPLEAPGATSSSGASAPGSPSPSTVLVSAGKAVTDTFTLQSTARYLAYLLLHQMLMECLAELALRTPDPDASGLITDIVTVSQNLTKLLITPAEVAQGIQDQKHASEKPHDDGAGVCCSVATAAGGSGGGTAPGGPQGGGVGEALHTVHGAHLVEHMQHLSKIVCLCLHCFVPRPSNPDPPPATLYAQLPASTRVDLKKSVFAHARSRLLMQHLCPLLNISYQATMIEASARTLSDLGPAPPVPLPGGNGTAANNASSTGLGSTVSPLLSGTLGAGGTGISPIGHANGLTTVDGATPTDTTAAQNLQQRLLSPHVTVRNGNIAQDAKNWVSDLEHTYDAKQTQKSTPGGKKISATAGGKNAEGENDDSGLTATGSEEEQIPPRQESVPYEPTVVSATPDGSFVIMGTSEGQCLVFSTAPSSPPDTKTKKKNKKREEEGGGRTMGGYQLVAELLGPRGSVTCIDFITTIAKSPLDEVNTSGYIRGSHQQPANQKPTQLVVVASADRVCRVFALPSDFAASAGQDHYTPTPKKFRSLEGLAYKGHGETITSVCWVKDAQTTIFSSTHVENTNQTPVVGADEYNKAGQLPGPEQDQMLLRTANSFAGKQTARSQQLRRATSHNELRASVPAFGSSSTTIRTSYGSGVVGLAKSNAAAARNNLMLSQSPHFFSAAEDRFVLRWNSAKPEGPIQRFAVPTVFGMSYSAVANCLVTVDADSRLCLYDGNCLEDYVYSQSPVVRQLATTSTAQQTTKRVRWAATQSSPKGSPTMRGPGAFPSPTSGGDALIFDHAANAMAGTGTGPKLPFGSRLEVSFGRGAHNKEEFDLSSVVLCGSDFAPFLSTAEESSDEEQEDPARPQGLKNRDSVNRKVGAKTSGQIARKKKVVLGPRRRETSASSGGKSLVPLPGRFAAVSAIIRTWRDCGDETVREAARLVDGRYVVFLYDIVHGQWLRSFRCDSITPPPIATRLHRTLRQELEDRNMRTRGRAVDAPDEDAEEDDDIDIVYNDSARERCFTFTPCFAGSRYLYVGSLDDSILVFDAFSGVLKRRLQPSPAAALEAEHQQRVKEGTTQQKQPSGSDGKKTLDGGGAVLLSESDDSSSGSASDDAMYLPTPFPEDEQPGKEEEEEELVQEVVQLLHTNHPPSQKRGPMEKDGALDPELQALLTAKTRTYIQKRLLYYLEECSLRVPALTTEEFHGPLISHRLAMLRMDEDAKRNQMGDSKKADDKGAASATGISPQKHLRSLAGRASLAGATEVVVPGGPAGGDGGTPQALMFVAKPAVREDADDDAIPPSAESPKRGKRHEVTPVVDASDTLDIRHLDVLPARHFPLSSYRPRTIYGCVNAVMCVPRFLPPTPPPQPTVGDRATPIIGSSTSTPPPAHVSGDRRTESSPEKESEVVTAAEFKKALSRRRKEKRAKRCKERASSLTGAQGGNSGSGNLLGAAKPKPNYSVISLHDDGRVWHWE